MYFRKDDGDTNWDFETNNNSSKSTETTIATATTGQIKLGFKITGTEKVDYYVNDVLAGTFDTNLAATEMTPTIHIAAGEGAAKTMSIDHIIAIQEK